MDFDDIVVGSGLAALGAALGTRADSRVLVIGNPVEGKFLHYDQNATVPCAFTGAGGLGNAWHGVIPTGWRNNFGGASPDGFDSLLKYFYPSINLDGRIQSPWLYVPWRAIRPQREFAKLISVRAGRLVMTNEAAIRVAFDEKSAHVDTASGRYYARRVWVAAGALHTPSLLEASFGAGLSRGLVSDHAFCYIGQVENTEAPKLSYSRAGIFFPAQYDLHNTALYSLRPARFAFRQLDFGIEQRALFGLPTGNAIAKIAKRASAGLLAEAFYNRFGLFPGGSMHSVYAQVVAPDAYSLGSNERLLHVRPDSLRAATDRARANQPYKGLVASRLADAHIPGIHLHHSLEHAGLLRVGVDADGSPVQVVDASTLENIGPDHHSFKMMLSAFDRVQAAVARNE
jgi:hypothetical protein